MQSAEKEARERGISMYPSDEDEESFGKCGSPPLQNAAAEMQTPDKGDRLWTGNKLAVAGWGQALRLYVKQTCVVTMHAWTEVFVGGGRGYGDSGARVGVELEVFAVGGGSSYGDNGARVCVGVGWGL